MSGSDIKNSKDQSLYPDIAINFVAEGALNAGNSPVTLTPVATFAAASTVKAGNRGHIANDGTGSFTIAISTDGTNYNTPWTLKQGEMYDLTGMSIQKIQLTRVAADSNYRVMVW